MSQEPMFMSIASATPGNSDSSIGNAFQSQSSVTDANDLYAGSRIRKVNDKEPFLVAERYKTQLCANFTERGTCSYRGRCMFAHGMKELRTIEQNRAEGLITFEAIDAFKAAIRQRKALRDARRAGIM